MNKKVYIVNGSEDGLIGIYTNIKRAYEASMCYKHGEEGEAVKSYATCCKEMREMGWCEVVDKPMQYTCTISWRWLNQ